MSTPNEVFEKSKKPPKPMRRFDELAWLIEGNSMCTAVCIVNSKLLISANEFSENTSSRNNNQLLNFICEVMEYFQTLANG